MGKLWTFGDSFTAGHGCLPNDPYYNRETALNKDIWPDIIASKLKLTVNNLGIPGNSTPYILKQIIENLTNFKKEDIIILSDTHSTRTVLYHRYKKKIEPVATEIVFWENLNENSEDFIQTYFLNEAEKKLYVEFLHSFIYKYDNEWNDFYREQLDSIAIYLNNIGVRTYFWSYNIWFPFSKFTTIAEETKGKIKDGHWSWQGHKDFAEYLLERIDKKEYEYKAPLI